MQVEALLFNGLLLGGLVQMGGPGSVERVGYERRDGAEDEGGEIENARGENLGLPGGETGGGGVDGDERVDLEVLERVSPLVELEPGLGFHRRDVGGGPGDRVGSVGGSGLGGGDGGGGGGSLLSGFRGAGEHLDDLLEGGGVGLDEGGRVWVGGFGSGRDGLGSRNRSRRLVVVVVVVVVEVVGDGVAVGGAGGAGAVTAAEAGRRREQRRRWRWDFCCCCLVV